MSRTTACFAFVISLLGSPPAILAQCPPGTFDYGPVLDPHPEMIVIGHYGPGDPLIPTPADYQRAARDVALIHAAIPETIGQLHELNWEHDVLLIRTSNPAAPEMICANQFYQATMNYLCCGTWWLIEFPRSVNLLAMGDNYLAIPGVLNATVNGYGSTGGGPCFDSWGYIIDQSGNWHWGIYESHIEVFHGSSFCRSGGSWNVITTPEGQVTVVCYANCDHSLAPTQLSANDFQCFLNRFAAGDEYANCDASTTAPVLNVQDFGCFLNAFAAGCS